MARKRASLKDKGEEILGLKRGGQGADILFGTEGGPGVGGEVEDSPEEGLPQGEADLADTNAETGYAGKGAAGAQPAEEGLPYGEADLDELDLERLLGAEAGAAEGEGALPELATTPASTAPPAMRPTPPPPHVTRPMPAPPPVRASRKAPAAEPRVTGERPRPRAPEVVYAPPRPTILAPQPPSRPEAVQPPTDSQPRPVTPSPGGAPPSLATGAPDLSVPRPTRYVQLLGVDFDPEAEELSAEEAAAAATRPPEAIALSEEQREELLRRRPVQKQFAELDRAIDTQYERILHENLSVNKTITDWTHNMLAEARAILLAREVDKLPRAEWLIEQVRARLDRACESRDQANRYSVPILVWGVIWFVLFVYFIFNPMLLLNLITFGDASDPLLNARVFLQSLFFGGIGGVAAVFYHLFKYMRARSFDSQYVLSYFGKPLMGMITGSIVYLMFFGARFIGVSLFSSATPDSNIEGLRFIIYLVAIYAGFKENAVFDLLNRLIKAILGSQDEEEEEAAAPPAPAT
jgi:hypothetical protein